MRQTLIALSLAASLLAASGRSTLLDSFFTLLESAWTNVSADEGCGMDPHGGCSPAPQLQADAGCGMDPNGRCSSAPQLHLDEGCGADPDGCS